MTHGSIQNRPILSVLALAIGSLPIIYLVYLLSGGRASDFGAWRQAGYLIFSIPVVAAIGLSCLLFAVRRKESRIFVTIGFVIHVLYAFLILYVLSI